MTDIGAGTRFKLFPQPPWLAGYETPETVAVSSPLGSIAPGPADQRMFVIVPLDKACAYGFQTGRDGGRFLYLPPWTGPVTEPVVPDSDGHFDYLEPQDPGFQAAHLFGSVRFVLDIWERYFERPTPWHFRDAFERLELTLYPHWDNAQTGWGFIEVGDYISPEGVVRPYSLNFDVLAHEVGHAMIYSEVGLPDPETEAPEYFGFHESAADLVALVSVLHFSSVVDRVLANTSGNLYTLNRLNRFGELSENEQLRVSSNLVRLSEFSDGWRDEHHLAQPLTGAVFDVFVDIFHLDLLDNGLIDRGLAAMSDGALESETRMDQVQAGFDEAYRDHHQGFADALVHARDCLGCMLADAWDELSADYFDYVDVREALLAADRRLNQGCFEWSIRENFTWREIGRARIGPRLRSPGKRSHSHSARTITPETAALPDRRLSYRKRMDRARGV